MKNLYRYKMKSMKNLLLAMMMVLGVLSFSCKEDQLESIYIKRNGNLSITLLDGEEPVVGQEVKLYSAYSWSIMNALETDEKGTIDFGTLHEGSYGIMFHIEGEVHIEQEVQVISGGPTDNKVIQLKDYMGTYTVELFDGNTNEIIKDDHGYGIAIVPYIEVLEDVEEEDLVNYAREIKYFASGVVTFELPVYEYVAFLVKKYEDDYFEYVDEFYIEKLEEQKSRAYVELD